MLPLAEFLGVWAFLGVNIASPGPNVINTITTAMTGGRASGMASALGVGVGVGLWCLGMSFGMAAVFALWPPAQVVLTGVAVILLCGFAWRYLGTALAGFRGRAAVARPVTGIAGPRAAFLRSLAVNAMNPKALTSWLAVLSVFPIARAGDGDIAVLCLGAMALSFAIHAVYATLFSTGSALRLYQRFGWVLSGAAGLFFATVATGLVLHETGLAG
jgi:threonine/homoserine/homoserine lactone efflux protein